MKRCPVLHSEAAVLPEYFVRVSWSEVSAFHRGEGNVLIEGLVNGLGVNMFAELVVLDGGMEGKRCRRLSC